MWIKSTSGLSKTKLIDTYNNLVKDANQEVIKYLVDVKDIITLTNEYYCLCGEMVNDEAIKELISNSNNVLNALTENVINLEFNLNGYLISVSNSLSIPEINSIYELLSDIIRKSINDFAMCFCFIPMNVKFNYLDMLRMHRGMTEIENEKIYQSIKRVSYDIENILTNVVEKQKLINFIHGKGQ